MDLPRFIFRGNAVGVGGHIHEPEDVILWVQGASTLPVVGGYARSSVDRIAFGEYLTAESVKTHSNGDFSAKDKAFKTIATSSVRNVSITRRVTAELLEATLVSTHPLNGGQPSVVPTGTVIKNLRLDGFPVTLKLDVDLFTKHSTFESLANAYKNDDTFFKRYGPRFATRDPNATKVRGKREIPVVSGYVMCSIVEEIQTPHPRAKIEGNVITLPDFGSIYLGELLITSVSRRLTLLRAKLGPPATKEIKSGKRSPAPLSAGLGSLVTGDIACSEVEDNGIIVV